MEPGPVVAGDDLEEIHTEALTERFVVIGAYAEMSLQAGINPGIRKIVYGYPIDLFMGQCSFDPLF
jgi:hypothetical protein